jgi:Ca2+-dependent lipid-binding protein
VKLAALDSSSTKVTVHLEYAENLKACDSNGHSDPFFVIDVHPKHDHDKKAVCCAYRTAVDKDRF